MDTGLLITFEGIDGSGKSSAAQALYASLKDEFPVILTREPGATELGKRLRTILQNRTFVVEPKAEYLLFAADRAQHMESVVLPALKANKIVISDRMADSSLAYQGYARGVDPEMICSINKWAMQGRQPDLTVYLEIEYEVARKRLALRQEEATVFEQERAEFFERVSQGFEVAFINRKVVRIDASRSEQEVQKATYDAVYTFLIEQNHETSSRVFMDRA
jgi:dTMP kinase